MSDDTHVSSARFLGGLASIHPDRWSQPFWDSATEHRLVCQRCAECGTHRMPPAPRCWRCRSDQDAWTDLPGTGSVYSMTVVCHAPAADVHDEDLPYMVAVITLDDADNVKHVANVIGADHHAVPIGTRVEVDWEASGNDPTIPRFRILP